MSELSAQYAALSGARDHLDEIAGALEDERSSLGTSMRSLLDGEWTGPAARSFDVAFTEWSQATATVLGGLHSMADLIDQARARLSAQDDSVQRDVSALHARLGPS